MANGQPTGEQTDATTENGAYALNAVTTGNAVARNAVNPNTGAAPAFYIPLENEWYKAAYYDPTRGGGSGGYAVFATRSESPPDNVAGGAANQANYLTANGDYAVTQSGDYSSSQNGSLWEWNDLDGSAAPNRGLRGGAYTSTPPYLQSSYRMGYVPGGANANGGFRSPARVARAEEPRVTVAPDARVLPGQAFFGATPVSIWSSTGPTFSLVGANLLKVSPPPLSSSKLAVPTCW